MQKMWNLSKWLYVGEGRAIPFPNTRRRTVVLEVNCPAPMDFYVLQPEKRVFGNPEAEADVKAGRNERDWMRAAYNADPLPELAESGLDVPTSGRTVRFLAACRAGRDQLEFAVDGSFELIAVGGDAYVFTRDSQLVHTVIADKEIYTRIANRRQRNPHLELIMFQMKRNQMEFQAQLQAETDRRIKAIERGAKERYAKGRDQRAGVARAREEPSGEGQKLPPGTIGLDAGADGTSASEGGKGSGVAGAKGVPKAAPDARGKAKTPS